MIDRLWPRLYERFPEFQLVLYDVDQDVGEYWEPNVWVLHRRRV